MHADICHDDYDLSRWKPGLSIRGVHRLKTQILTRDVRRRKLVGATAVRTRLRRLSHFSRVRLASSSSIAPRVETVILLELPGPRITTRFTDRL